jgi:hypothetical protein
MPRVFRKIKAGVTGGVVNVGATPYGLQILAGKPGDIAGNAAKRQGAGLGVKGENLIVADPSRLHLLGFVPFQIARARGVGVDVHIEKCGGGLKVGLEGEGYSTIFFIG